MDHHAETQKIRTRRAARTRARVRGTAARPRLAVFRSNTTIYAQVINDEAHRTVAAASSREVAKDKPKTKTDAARLVGELIAKKAQAAKIAAVVFDRRSYRYHGRVKALADAVRAAGIQF